MGSLQCVRFSPSERQNKSASRREEDRLSSLPDEVLIHILSFVDIKSAVQTSMLISRRNLWTLFPTLNIDLNYLQPSAFSCNFLDRVLTLCSDSTKHVNVSISRTGQPDFKFVKRILNHAFICKVQHLSLNLEKYDVPVSLFPGRHWSIFPDASDSDLLLWSSLTSLRVKCEENAVSCPKAGDLHIPSFLQLTTLHLERPYIVDANFLLSCPNLQNLTLTQSCFSQLPPNLIISASKLSNLNLSYHESSVMYVKLELEAPNLRLLKLEGPHSLHLVDDTLPYLDTVNINFLSLSPLKEHHEVLTDMLECLHTANSLTLTWNTIELLSMFPDTLASKNSFENLKSLRIIKSGWSKSCDKAIPAEVKTYLLKNSPCAQIMQ